MRRNANRNIDDTRRWSFMTYEYTGSKWKSNKRKQEIFYASTIFRWKHLTLQVMEKHWNFLRKETEHKMRRMQFGWNGWADVEPSSDLSVAFGIGGKMNFLLLFCSCYGWYMLCDVLIGNRHPWRMHWNYRGGQQRFGTPPTAPNNILCVTCVLRRLCCVCNFTIFSRGITKNITAI